MHTSVGVSSVRCSVERCLFVVGSCKLAVVSGVASWVLCDDNHHYDYRNCTDDIALVIAPVIIIRGDYHQARIRSQPRPQRLWASPWVPGTQQGAGCGVQVCKGVGSRGRWSRVR